MHEGIEERMREYGRGYRCGGAPPGYAQVRIPVERCRSRDDGPRKAGHQAMRVGENELGLMRGGKIAGNEKRTPD